MESERKLIIAALDQFCHVECPHCGKNISWPEYYSEKEIEEWIKRQNENISKA